MQAVIGDFTSVSIATSWNIVIALIENAGKDTFKCDFGKSKRNGR